eukprot:9466673-Pyramimonas_sp.AAC.1
MNLAFFFHPTTRAELIDDDPLGGRYYCPTSSRPRSPCRYRDKQPRQTATAIQTQQLGVKAAER